MILLKVGDFYEPNYTKSTNDKTIMAIYEL